MMSQMVISLRQVLAKEANRPRRMYSVEHEGSDLTLKKIREREQLKVKHQFLSAK